MNPSTASTVNGPSPHPPRAGLEPAVTQGRNDRRVGSANGLAHVAAPDPQTLSHSEMGHINIASLNIKGANSPSTINKWKMISKLVLKNNIALMCAIETHSDDKLIESLNKKHNPKLTFLHTHDHEKPKTKGITILTNIPLTNCPPTNIHTVS